MKAQTPSQIREYATFSVIYWGVDDKPKEIIQVRPVALRGKTGMLRDVIAIQDELIKHLVLNNACIGALVNDDVVWEAMLSMAKILPVVGKEKPGFEIESIAEAGDIAQLGRIFFTESITSLGQHETDENGDRPLTKPSSIARIHDLNFHSPLFQYNEERQEALHKERMEKIETTLEAQQVSEAVAA